MAYKLTPFGVTRVTDGAHIPPDVRNVDWVAYQKWLAEGNTPQPADLTSPAPVDPLDALRTALQNDPTLLDRIKATR